MDTCRFLTGYVTTLPPHPPRPWQAGNSIYKNWLRVKKKEAKKG